MPRLPQALVLLITLIVSTTPALAQVVPMGDLHCNDALGNPAPPYETGTPVEVSGIVTAGSGIFATYTSVHIQDDTGAINLYRNDVPWTFVEGDSVTCSGTMNMYRGLTEIDLTATTIHSSGHDIPEPTLLTCSDVSGQFGPDNCEPEESMLIQINDVTFTGTWGANQLVTLYDTSGSCSMYIDADTGVGSSPAPDGEFDVVGILRQYDTSSPYTTGHQLMPRWPTDILQDGPTIVAGPTETDLFPNEVTITWTTDGPATSRIDYGYTDTYELGTVEDPTMLTDHSLTLIGLDPARIHLYKVTTTDAGGETVVSNLRFCSGSRSSGEIEVYFNKTVDHGLALGENANGNTNLISVLVERISHAIASIDVALYSFDLSSAADALISAHQNGVEIRFITENRATLQEQVQRLIAAGIPVITDEFGSNGGSGLMHHKFWVFDHRRETDPSDDYVFTGSWNITSQGTYTDAQNLMVIQDESVAEIYTAEFEEMWGSSTMTPNSSMSRTGSNKLDDTPKIVNIGGLDAVIYFGPSDDTMRKITERVAQTQRSVHFGILSFTRFDVGNAMRERFLSVPGYAVRGVFDSAESGNTSSQYHEMIGGGDYPWDPPGDIWLDTETGSLHHKYIIFDVNDQVGDPAILTGSSNWSNNAHYSNDENIIMVEDFRLANLYFQEFSQRYHAAGGSADLTVDVPEGELSAISRLHAFPNPAHPELTIQLRPTGTGPIRLTLLDVSGRRLESREVEANGGAGRNLSWDFGNRPAGIYFLRVFGAGIDAERRITLLR